MTESRIDRRFAALKEEGRPALVTFVMAATRTTTPRSSDPQGAARGRRRRDRARHAVLRPDGRRPGDPGRRPARAQGRPDADQDAGHGARLPRRRRRHADRADGLLQPDLFLRQRALPRRRQGGRRRRPDRRRPAARGGRRALPAGDRPGINFIRLATPTTDDKRLPAVLANTSGFVYYVSMLGITGTALPDTTRIAGAVERIKRHTILPVAVGFGVKTADQARAIGRAADGVVVGIGDRRGGAHLARRRGPAPPAQTVAGGRRPGVGPGGRRAQRPRRSGRIGPDTGK